MKTLALMILVFASGCATIRPQARVIDATNKGPILSRSVEKETIKESKAQINSKKTSYDFTF